jgi:hypothetical protein
MRTTNDHELRRRLAKAEADRPYSPDVDAELALEEAYVRIWQQAPDDLRRRYERQILTVAGLLMHFGVEVLPTLDRVRAGLLQRLAAALVRITAVGRATDWRAPGPRPTLPRPIRTLGPCATSAHALVYGLSRAPGAPPTCLVAHRQAVATS